MDAGAYATDPSPQRGDTDLSPIEQVLVWISDRLDELESEVVNLRTALQPVSADRGGVPEEGDPSDPVDHENGSPFRSTLRTVQGRIEQAARDLRRVRARLDIVP